jgi:glycosyltransferase involved in cell wall biosynthesis
MKPEASLIISFYNNIQLLTLIFAALERQTCSAFEVIIADDGSKPEVVQQLKRLIQTKAFPVKHCWHTDDGWRKNAILNKAIQASQCDYLVFIDGDCIPHPRFIEEHLAHRKEGVVLTGRRVQLTPSMSSSLTETAVITGQFERLLALRLFVASLFHKSLQPENALRIRSPRLRKLLIKDKEKGILGCNFSVFKADILLVNGFDERFQHPGVGEDTDLNSRLVRAGIKTLSKKHLLTVYHIYHKRFDLNYPPNFALWEENNTNHVTFTPFGINKPSGMQSQ